MTTILPANETWFTFSARGGNFSVYAFKGHEEVNKPYEVTVELVSRSASEDLTSLLGTEACLAIRDRSGGARHIHGLIREMEQLHTANTHTHYRAILVPRLWYLDKIRDHRIFQNRSVSEIIQQILTEQGFAGSAIAFKLFYTYSAREYCVQYNETSLHFISRLCEEEGIYFYFEHSENSHKLCFCDREGGPKIPGENSLRFYPGSGQAADTAVISRLNCKTQVNSNAATYREWNFGKPRLNLEVQRSEADAAKAPAPQGMLLEQYQYPHLYQLPKPGGNYAEVQLLRQLTFSRSIRIESDVSRFVPSYTFNIHEHPRSDVNTGWWVVTTQHEGEQPGVLEHEAPEGRGLYYRSKVTAIPEMTRYIPALEHPKKRITGQQTAIVTGLQGEEVFTDKYSRVKVQFHWDRRGARDENSSCWIRVSAGWAGDGFGFIHIPRVGQEVLVEHLEGDPDRPIITGRAYYEENMPPWQLPEQKTLSGIQSREFKAGRRNQLVMDDTKEEIQTQLSSDHLLSQLNLGYITRIDHAVGRKDFRGEGFELRTDGWGVTRAGKGLYITTYPRTSAERHQKDVAEASKSLEMANEQHKNTGNVAVLCSAQDRKPDADTVSSSIEKQINETKGSGEPHGEFTQPHLVLASPSGVAVTALESLHIHTGQNTAITSERHTSVSTGKSFLVSAAEKVSLFANKLGMRLMAAKGKVEIEAQSDAMNVIADKKLSIFSAKDSVHISAPEEIVLTAGGSYIKITANGIEQGTSGAWNVHAASHNMTGPKTMPYLSKEWKDGIVPPNARVIMRDELGRVIDVDRAATHGSGNINNEEALHPLYLFHNTPAEELQVSTVTVAGMQCVQTFSAAVNLTRERAVDMVGAEDLGKEG